MSSKPSYQANLAALAQADTSKFPAIFLAHGSPLLLWPEHLPTRFGALDSIGGPKGPHKKFLSEFGPWLLKTYNPKAIVVFSAHWETDQEIEVMDYETNHLLYDYYGFPDEMYKITWESKGSHEVAERVVELLKKSNIPAKTITQGRGLDHGVFIPFKIMFPSPSPIPIIEVSIPSSLDPSALLALGKALSPLRSEGTLIISGGLTIHTFREPDAWNPQTAPQGFKDFENEVKRSVEAGEGEERNGKLVNVTSHEYFRRAHPREEHFVPIYVAAGAGSEGKAKVLSDLHGAITIAYGYEEKDAGKDEL
ncbi:hypothetical protein HDV00_007689 [Rhizophlyctis rosea]|nr:hypothetical protein HDV00_007689 [Rhizophlyctis rosea]